MLLIIQFADIDADRPERLSDRAARWKAGLRKSVRVSLWAKAFWSPAFSDGMKTFAPA